MTSEDVATLIFFSNCCFSDGSFIKILIIDCRFFAWYLCRVNVCHPPPEEKFMDCSSPFSLETPCKPISTHFVYENNFVFY